MTFQVIAHRGDCAHAPENTLPAFRLALEKKADGIETDVRATRDGVPVLLHDANLKRTTGVDALVEELTWDDVRQLDAGILRGPAFAGTRVSRLDEFLAEFLPRIPLQIELKAERAIEPTLELIRRNDAVHRVLITSFEREFLVTAFAEEPRIHAGWLLNDAPISGVSGIKALGCRVAIPHASHVTAEYVQAAQASGLRVRAWGVKNLETAITVIQAGAEAATYNDPGELLNHLLTS
jgi:glycerophosphoryl diester phosphodiesterase